MPLTLSLHRCPGHQGSAARGMYLKLFMEFSLHLHLEHKGLLQVLLLRWADLPLAGVEVGVHGGLLLEVWGGRPQAVLPGVMTHPFQLVQICKTKQQSLKAERHQVAFVLERDLVGCLLKFGSTTKVLAERMLKYYRILLSEAAYEPCMKWAVTVPQHTCQLGRCSGSEA